MKKRSLEPSESQIQCAIVEWAKINKIINKYNKEKTIYFGDYLIAIPNGGNRSITEAVRLKKEGVKPGVSDLFFACPSFNGKNKNGLWMEVKNKKGKVTKCQYEWIKLMCDANYEACIVYSVDEGINAIKDHMGIV